MKYALTIFERSQDGSLSINTHTGAGMQMLAGATTPDDYLALAISWYDQFPGQDNYGAILAQA